MSKILILSLLLLTACTRPGAVQEEFKNLPEGLADCKFYRLTDVQGSQSLIARCPNSSTTAKKVDSKLPEMIIIDQPNDVPASPDKDTSSSDFIGPLPEKIN